VSAELWGRDGAALGAFLLGDWLCVLLVLEDGFLGLLHVEEQGGDSLVLSLLLELLESREVVLGEAVVVAGLLGAGEADVVLELHRRFLPRQLLIREDLRVFRAQPLASLP